MDIDKAAARESDFGAARAARQRHVDREMLAGISHAVLRGRTRVGWAASAGPTASSAALLLREEGRFALDDPIEHYLPQLGRRRVLTI